MIREWYEPANFLEWFRRVFSFLNIVILMMTAALVFSEFRFDWFENLVGSYLTSTNERRPETGVIWETGKQASSAHEYLNTIISQKESTRENLHTATSFTELASGIVPGEWVTLEKEQFKALYLSLDNPTAKKIIEPAQLVWLLNGSSLDRIFCEGIPKGIKIYFIDSENRVIRQIDLEEKDIDHLENGETPFPGGLDDMAGFSGRIYPADDFFTALFKLTPDIVPDLMVNPKILLEQEGKISRFGIWNESANGYIKLGFEFRTSEGRQVIFVKGREWAVWQLSLNLKGRTN